MRRSLSTAAVLGIVATFTLVGPAGAAHAELGVRPGISFDASAPPGGSTVSGIRDIDGVARAVEGVRRVDLYVVRHSSDAAPGRSSATLSTSVPVNALEFSLRWDTASTLTGRVDLLVVATTPTRQFSARISDLRVPEPAAPAVAPTLPKPTVVKAPVAPASVRPAAPVRASVVRAAPVRGAAAAPASRRVLARAVTSPATDARQAAAFYRTYGRLDYAAGQRAAAPPALRSPLAGTGEGPWPAVAAGLVLMLTGAHIQRALRSDLAPLG